MRQAMLGSTIGGLIAGTVAIVAATQLGARAPEGQAAQPMTMTNTNGPVVECGPYQQPAMARVFVAGREATALTCVDGLGANVASYPPQPAYAQGLAQPVYAPAPRQAVQQVPVVRERVIVEERQADRREGKRSWAKTALIIGGSSGAGAGIGGLAGGKKGALIGAAIGGGAASIFEAVKR